MDNSQTFRAFKLNLGIPDFPEDFRFNGTKHRFGKNKRYSLVGACLLEAGKTYSWATLVDYSGDIEKKVYRSWDGSDFKMPGRVFRKYKNAKIAHDERIKKDFSEYYNELDLADETNEYIVKKKLILPENTSYPLKKGYDESLIVPMVNVDTAKIEGIEYIHSKGKSRKKGSSLKGLVYPVSNAVTEKVFLAEGVADALTIHECTKCETYACFGVYNLEETAKKMALKNQNKFFIVCHDSPTRKQLDHLKEQKKMSITPPMYIKEKKNVFDKFLNVFVLFPTSGNINEDGDFSIKDFNDLYSADPQMCEDILSLADNFPRIILLGRIGVNVIRVFTSVTNSEEEIRDNSKLSTLLCIAPEEFWKTKFGTIKERTIINALFSACMKRRYDPDIVKSGGALLDNKNLVINNGEGTIYGTASDEYVYLPRKPFPYNPLSDKLSDNTKKFLKTLMNQYFKAQNYSSEYDGYAVLAWAILSLICQIIPAKFILALSGASGLGKSDNYNYFISKIQKSFKSITTKINPQTTFPAFKKMMREGIISVFMEEAQAGNYSQMYIPYVRETIYNVEKGSIGQLTHSGTFISTPVNSMIAMSYNFRPEFETADLNRCYEIDFSLAEHITGKSLLDSRKFLREADLASVGEDLVNFTLNNFENFERIYQKNVLNEYYSPKEINSHKINIFNMLISWYETLECFTDKELNIYKRFLQSKGKAENVNDDPKDVVQTIGRIRVYAEDRRDSITIRDLFNKVPVSYSVFPLEYDSRQGTGIDTLAQERIFFRFYGSFCSFFQAKVFVDRTRNELVLAIPSSPTFREALRQLGIPPKMLFSVAKLVNSLYKMNRNVRIYGQIKHCIVIPVKVFLPVRAKIESWKAKATLWNQRIGTLLEDLKEEEEDDETKSV